MSFGITPPTTPPDGCAIGFTGFVLCGVEPDPTLGTELELPVVGLTLPILLGESIFGAFVSLRVPSSIKMPSRPPLTIPDTFSPLTSVSVFITRLSTVATCSGVTSSKYGS